MKFVSLLVVIAIIYVAFVRSHPNDRVEKALAETETPVAVNAPRDPTPPLSTNALKRPLDRTHAALDQVRTRNGNGEF